MYDVIIIRYGEMGLKGKNFKKFSRALQQDIKRRLANLLDYRLETTYGRIFLRLNSGLEEIPREAVKSLKLLPGIVNFSPAITLEPSAEPDKIAASASRLIARELGQNSGTFKVETNRANKDYPLISPEVSKKVGGLILKRVNHSLTSPEQKLTVDVHEPEILLELDIRKDGIYVFSRRYQGSGGLPLGSAESALLLLSAGIDSPVAGWQMMRRGARLDIFHFHTPPYTGEKALEKVRDISRKLARYNGETGLYLSRITKIQREIQKCCQPDYSVTILRRMMMRIASRLGERLDSQAIVTGDSLGQVASQTITNLRTISTAADLPVLRPLLTLDKQDIINQARDIQTYNISIRPHQDCCTIFVPENPITRPYPGPTAEIEKALPVEELVAEALEKIEEETIEADL